MRRVVLRALTLSEPFAAARCEILSNPSQPLRAVSAKCGPPPTVPSF
jgi:hypothetical protein